MARIDDYYGAKEIAVKTLSEMTFDKLLQRSGFEQAGDNVFKINFLDHVYHAAFPDFDFQNISEPEKEVPIQEQVLILHYMTGSSMKNSTDEWIAYREIKGASFYFGVFVKRAIDPLKKVFGQNVSGLVKVAQKLEGKPINAGDAGFEFQVLPHAPVQLILWEGDEEFSPEANILFKENIGDYLSPEDAAWFAGMLVYRMIALSYAK